MVNYIKNHFNDLFFYKKRLLIPFSIISLFIGICIGLFAKNFKLNIGCELIMLIIVNCIILLFVSYATDFEENQFNYKPLYWILNSVCYSIIIFINFDYLIFEFKDVNIKYINKNTYILLFSIGIFIIIMWLFYCLMFSSIKKTKITTSGLEIEVDDMKLSQKQNQIINDLQKVTENVQVVFSNMDKLLIEFAQKDLIDDNNKIDESYDFNKLFDQMRIMSSTLFKIDSNSIVADFKSISTLNEIKEEYKIPINLYNKIYAKIINEANQSNSIFIERNLIFVNYQLVTLYHTNLINNRVVAIIECQDMKDAYIGYGSLLLSSLINLDNILGLILSTVDIEEVDENES